MMENVCLFLVVIFATLVVCIVIYLYKDNNIIQEDNSKIMGLGSKSIIIDNEVRALEQQNMWLEVDRRIESAIKKHELESKAKK